MSAMKKLSDVTPHEKKPIVAEKKKTVSNKKLALLEAKETVRRHRRTMVIATAVSIALLALVAVIMINLASNNTRLEKPELKPPTKQSEQVKPKYYSPLTGIEVAEESITKKPVIAVMIENSIESRPQSGLKDAGVVFEAVAEGGVTRFIALYQDSEPSSIGPVRSVRSYYLDWAAAFSPAVAHVGGSSDALKMLRSGNYGVDIDQSANGSSYWRVRDRKAPHNVYTDYSHLNKLSESKGKIASNFNGFVRQDSDNKASEKEPAAKISMAISSGRYAVSYDYDKESNTYKRFQGGEPHRDREKGQVTPSVVIAIIVNQILKTDRLHMNIATSGAGECLVFQNGTVTKGSWQKSNSSSQIKFLDESDREIELNRGQTWITAVPEGKAINWQ